MVCSVRDFPIQKISRTWPFSARLDSLYVQGSLDAYSLLDLLPTRALAVVGTRKPQGRVEALVRRTVHDLRKSGLVIISGLAVGVDTCAHEAALEAGLPTIAVLGCGLEHQYPKENEELRTRILESGGLVVSEYPPDELPKPHYFLLRNRLIAGFAQATWVAHAPARSGALNTASWARSENRDCYATPGFPGDPALLGNQKLLDDHHAHPIWGAHSLGKTWLELSSIGLDQPPSHLNALTQGKDAFLEIIHRRTAQSGGITASDLLDWAIQNGFSPLEFFERLQKSQQCGLVSERNGVLVMS